MNSYPQCQKHLYSPLQFLDISQDNCLWICGSCYHNLNDKTNSKIIDLFQIKQNPYLLKNIFPATFKDSNEMLDILKNIEIFHNNQIVIMKKLIQILNQNISDVIEQKEKFKNLVLDIKKKEYIALNVEKFQELIKSSWKLSKNFTEDIKQQFEMQFLDCVMKIQNQIIDFKNERQQILKFYENKNLSEPLVQFENQLNRIKTLIKNDDISTFQQILFEKDFKSWIFSQVQKIEGQSINQTNLIYKGENINQLETILYKKTQDQKKHLMIFQSKKQQNVIFGAYTPYEQKTANQIRILYDTSFLFQYNTKIFFPIQVERTIIENNQPNGLQIASKDDKVRLNLDYRTGQCSFQASESQIFADYVWIYDL